MVADHVSDSGVENIADAQKDLDVLGSQKICWGEKKSKHLTEYAKLN